MKYFILKMKKKTSSPIPALLFQHLMGELPKLIFPSQNFCTKKKITQKLNKLDEFTIKRLRRCNSLKR